MLGQRPHHGEDGAILQKRQLARTEVVEQSAERLRPNSHLWMQPPAAIRVEHAGSVNAAHSVDGHLFNQNLGNELELGLGLGLGWVVHMNCLS
jgi:hypothetical protein